MILSANERAQLVAVARFYYEDNLTQAQIAQRLGVSRPSVSKMLTRAKEIGIVHIEIRAGDEGEVNLLEQLQTKYALHGGCVLTENKNIYSQVAAYFAAETAADVNLGLGWGYSLGEVLDNGPKRLHHQNGIVFPLLGNAHIPNKGYHPDELVRLWGEVSGRSTYNIGSPAFPDSEEERDCLEKKNIYKELRLLWQQMDAAVVTINNYPGVPDEATATRFGDALKQQKAVGSFVSYYYNERGEFISGNNDFCLHIPLAYLRRCRKVIGIGVNASDKALKGALNTGLLTHLLVREEQARKLLF